MGCLTQKPDPQGVCVCARACVEPKGLEHLLQACQVPEAGSAMWHHPPYWKTDNRSLQNDHGRGEEGEGPTSGPDTCSVDQATSRKGSPGCWAETPKTNRMLWLR